MKKKRNILRAALAVAATGAALLVPAMPAGATPGAGAVAVDVPCGVSYAGAYGTYRNCEDHAVKVHYQYLDGIGDAQCIQAGATQLLGEARWIFKEADSC
ncbi:hypothetical protein [Kitasatospora sp. NPDC093558]|uniref:hypothetical protein n=1 Tax=Kitasatospora sp. NPDC093558 TaxID=3155201 RepID=UPI00342E799F